VVARDLAEFVGDVIDLVGGGFVREAFRCADHALDTGVVHSIDVEVWLMALRN
jgi:hypothetical protein